MFVFLQEIGAAAIMTKEEDLCRLFTFSVIFYHKVLTLIVSLSCLCLHSFKTCNLWSGGVGYEGVRRMIEELWC